jgi:cephalosporin-C deacetylase-like acetyl esterase
LNEHHSKEDLLSDVRRRIALTADIKPATRSAAGEVQRDGYVIRKLTFRTEPGITVPALLAEPREASEKLPLVLYVHGRGKSYDAAPGGPVEQLVKQGRRVLAVDLRGMGETSSGTLPPPGKPNLLGVDYTDAQLSLHLARPLLGQRVLDLVSVLNAMPAEAGVEAVGIESAGPIVLHAAALDRRISRVTLRQSLVSWSAVARSPVSDNQLTNVVPGALQSYDLPDLMGSLPPGSVTVQSQLDALGKPAEGR